MELRKHQKRHPMPIEWLKYMGVKPERLELQDDYLRNERLSKSVLHYVGPKLQSIVLNLNDGWQNPPGLRTKRLRCAISISTICADIKEYCLNVQTLIVKNGMYNLVECDFSLLPHNLTTIHFSELAPLENRMRGLCALPNLTSLSMTWKRNMNPFPIFPDITSTTVRKLKCWDACVCAYFPNVTHLTMMNIEVVKMVAIAQYCRHVQNVSINLNNVALQIASLWRDIRNMYLQMTDAAASLFRARCPLLKSC